MKLLTQTGSICPVGLESSASAACSSVLFARLPEALVPSVLGLMLEPAWSQRLCLKISL